MTARHIALVGFMAAGKTTIGRLLARDLGMPFVDTDQRIVAARGAIAEIFARDGEAGFRAAEYAAVTAVLAEEPCVLALGGGAITYEPTRLAVRDGAVSVYLNVAVPELVSRLKRSPTIRPVVGSEPTIERVTELLALREPFYRAANVTVDGPYPTKDEYAAAIVRALADAGLARRRARDGAA